MATMINNASNDPTLRDQGSQTKDASVPFHARLLKVPSYGWVSDKNHPTERQIQAEWRHNLRHNPLVLFTWLVWLATVVCLVLWVIAYATISSAIAGLIYGFVFLPQYGTFYFHRFGVHGAFRFRHRLFAWLAKHAAVRLIPDEVYVLSHHVHHAVADQDGDPYDPRGGWWYCFLADANHQSVHPDLDQADHQRALGLLKRQVLWLGGYATYRRWGMLVHPMGLILDFGGNWLFWGAVCWAIGGPSLALAIFGSCALWMWGIRNFNFRAHGAGQDLRQAEVDLHRGDLSVNQTLSAWLASEWHNNHHLCPTSAKAGFEWWQLDVVYAVVQALHKVGVVRSYRDDSARYETAKQAQRAQAAQAAGSSPTQGTV